jgi:CHAT domain-containing protein
MKAVLLLCICLTACGTARIEELRADNERARNLLKTGDLKQALLVADSALARCGSSPEWCWRLRILKAEVLVTSRRAKECLALLGGPGSPPSIELQSRRAMHQGWAAFLLSNYKQADQYLREAYRLAEASASPDLVAEVELRRSLLLAKQGRFDDGEAALRQGLELVRTHSRDEYLEADLMGNLGVLFSNGYRYEEAIYWLLRAHALFTRLGASSAAARTIGNLGTCYYSLGDSEKALASFEDATARFEKAGDTRNEQTWLGNSGTVLLDAENYAAAAEHYQRALAIAQERKDHYWTAAWMSDLAIASLRAGQLDAAVRYNQESLAINQDLKDSVEQLYNQLNTAEIAVARKQFANAEGLLLAILDSSSEDPTPALQAQEDLAKLYIETGEPSKAEAQFQSAITAIERRQAGLTKEDYKISYLASLVRFYRSYVDFLIGRGEIGQALMVAESSRARILTERANSGIAEHKAWSAAQVQALARSSHRILLSYWLAPKQSYLWAITPDKIQLFELPPEKELRTLVESYRTVIEDLRDPLESQNPAGLKLAEVLLGPLRDLVPPGSHVVIVPDGALHSLNFASLPAPEDPKKYWIEDVTPSVAPSLGLLLNSRASATRKTTGLLAIGDPESPGQEFPRLPNAGQELETISALFPDSDRVVYKGAVSQPSIYARSNPARFEFIHFAAHATANRASPLDSALVLSPEGSSYALTARQIMKIPLNATVVTLSSCRSAGARAYSGEGLVGLAWAFLQAGAQNVIAGLWDVDDQSTFRLMSETYRGLTRGARPDAALRIAQLSLIRDIGGPFHKPYYWGPFQVYVGRGE